MNIGIRTVNIDPLVHFTVHTVHSTGVSFLRICNLSGKQTEILVKEIKSKGEKNKNLINLIKEKSLRRQFPLIISISKL